MLPGQHQMFLMLVDLRFPELVELAKTLTEHITDPEVLQHLALQIKDASDSQQAEQALTALYKRDQGKRN